MPTGLNGNTLGGVVVGAWRVYAGASPVDLGATYGEPTITPTDDYTQLPVSGLTTKVVGLDFLRSASCRVEFTLAAIVGQNLTLANRDVAPTGIAPTQQWTPHDAHTFVPATNYIEELIVIAQRTDGVWAGVRIPFAFVESREMVSEGDFKGLRFVCESRAPVATPFAAQYEFITRATTPA